MKPERNSEEPRPLVLMGLVWAFALTATIAFKFEAWAFLLVAAVVAGMIREVSR